MNSNLNLTRRDYLYGLGSTLGTIAFNALLQQESMGDERAHQGPLSIQTPHHAARAQRCIFIFLEGGPSHIDTFDPKPALEKVHLQKFTRQNKLVSNMGNGKRYYVASPFKFKQVSDSGIHMNTEFSQLAGVADQLCVFHGLQGDSINHPTAPICIMMTAYGEVDVAVEAMKRGAFDFLSKPIACRPRYA